MIKALHHTIAKLGIQAPKGVHVGIHCFRHGVTKMMRHGDPVVTLKYYSHIVGSAEHDASEQLSSKIAAQLTPELESGVDLESVSEKTA